MGFFGNLFGRRPTPKASQQALIIHLKMSSANGADEERARLHELEDKVIQSIDRSGEGEYDGNEIGEGEYVLYLYGPDADRLWRIVQRHFQGSAIHRGSYARKRYGEPGAREIRVELGGT